MSDVDLISCRHALIGKDTEIAALKQQVQRWQRAVVGVTPGGSEYVDDPERCAEYFLQRTNYPRQIIELREQVRSLERERDEAAAARGEQQQPYRGPINQPCSVCTAGDTAMEHHDHEYVRPENRRHQQGGNDE